MAVPTANPLAAYLDAHGLTQSGFARLSGINGVKISQWINGRRRPDLDGAFAIEVATGGAVPASVWLRMPVSSPESRVRPPLRASRRRRAAR